MPEERSAAPGRPFGDLFLERAGGQVDRRDPKTVEGETGLVGRDVQDQPWQRTLLTSIQGRRSVQSPDFVRSPLELEFSVRVDPAQGKTVLNVQGYVLVRTGDYLGWDEGRPRRLRNVLQDYVYTARLADAPLPPEDRPPLAEQGRLQSRLTKLVFDTLSEDALLDVVELLHENGFDASFDHIVPLHNGVVIKSNTAIRATGRTLPPPAQDGTGAMVVALVDTGIRSSERQDRWLDGIQTNENKDPLDVYPLVPGPDGLLDFGAGHGTFVAGIVQQVAPDAKVAMYRAIDSDGIGSEVAVAIAMVQAAADGADVLSLSLGTETLDDYPPLALTVAMQILAESYPRVLVVAAAGNSGSGELCWPSAFPGVVSVAALDADLTRANWSNTGPWVDFCTVGQGVLSTFVPGIEAAETPGGPPGDSFGPDAPWGLGTGTSFAAPQVAGAIVQLVQNGVVSTTRDAVRYLKSLSVDQHDGYGVPLSLLPGTRI